MEKMLRGIILSLMVVLSLSAVCSRAGVTRDVTADSLMEEEFVGLEPKARHPREILSILSALKSQFRQIIKDIFNMALQTMKSFLTLTTNSLLRNLENFSVSDVLRLAIDSFVESDLAPELYVDTVVEPVAIEPIEVEPMEVKVYRSPYSLNSLLNH